MATATYVHTTDVGAEPDRKAISIVSVDGQEVEAEWWPSLKTQWGAAGVKAYLEAEALFGLGFYADGRAKLQTLVTGTDTRTYNAQGILTGGTDTRNWAKRWNDEHPDPAPVTPIVDPLL